MSKRKKPTRQGRSGDPRKRAAEEVSLSAAEAAPELEDEVAAALELGHPIDIAMLASSLITSLDPALAPPGSDLPAADEFVRMFLDSGGSELVTLAWVAAQLLPDPRLQTSADLAAGPHSLPDWLLALSSADVVSAWQTTDPLYDSTDIVVSLRVGDADLSVIGLIDFNSGGAIKDAFAVPVPLAAVQEALSASGQTGMQTRDLDPADARVWLEQGIAAGLAAEPPFETDTWPQIRPLLQWALRRCPTGGQGWQRRVWTSSEVRAVVAEFAASAEGAVAADPVDQELLTDALVLLGDGTYGDPLLLGAVKLEMGLTYRWPTALHHDLDRLLGLPDLLIPYVRWAHAQRDIPADDTDAALAAIAHRRAEFVRDVTALLGDEDSVAGDGVDAGGVSAQDPTA